MENKVLFEYLNRYGRFQITYQRANWVIVGHKDSEFTRAIAVESGAKDSHFGDRHYLLRLLGEGHMAFEEFTDAGIGFMRGLQSVLLPDGGRLLKF